MKTRWINLLNDSLIALVGMLLVILGGWAGAGINPLKALPGALITFILVFIILLYKTLLPKSKFPTFAMALLLGVIMAIPYNPLSHFVLENTESILFLATTTPILAFAGLSMGERILQLKSLGWRLIVVSIIVFISTYFLSAIIVQMYFKYKGVF